MKKGGKVK